MAEENQVEPQQITKEPQGKPHKCNKLQKNHNKLQKNCNE